MMRRLQFHSHLSFSDTISFMQITLLDATTNNMIIATGIRVYFYASYKNLKTVFALGNLLCANARTDKQ